MMGVFVQVNEESPKARACPLGYVIQESGCWSWVGALNAYGYGKWRLNGRLCLAHRIFYKRVKGPIPDGFHLDHLCRNPSCVNPDHLEAVTCRENLLRGIGPSAQHAKKTHCPQGHPYNDTNTYRPHRGGRQCIPCRQAAEKRRVRR